MNESNSRRWYSESASPRKSAGSVEVMRRLMDTTE